MHRLVHCAFGSAAAWDVVLENVASLAKPPKAPKTELTILTEDQVEVILRHIEGRTLRPIVSFLLGTGCLRGEVLALRWRDVDWNTACVRIERFLEKIKKEGLRFKPLGSECSRRAISMSPLLLAELRAHLVRQRDRPGSIELGRAIDEHLVFAKWDGSTRAPNWLTQKFGLATPTDTNCR